MPVLQLNTRELPSAWMLTRWQQAKMSAESSCELTALANRAASPSNLSGGEPA